MVTKTYEKLLSTLRILLSLCIGWDCLGFFVLKLFVCDYKNGSVRPVGDGHHEEYIN